MRNYICLVLFSLSLLNATAANAEMKVAGSSAITSCENMLSTNPLQQKVLEYRDAILTSRTAKDKKIVHSAIRGVLQEMNSTLLNQMFAYPADLIDANVVASGRSLVAFTDAIIQDKAGLTELELIKLSFSYSQHYSLFNLNRNSRDVETTLLYTKGATAIFKNKDQVLSYVTGEKRIRGFDNLFKQGLDLRDLTRRTIVMPTFLNLKLKDMIWALSRGVSFVGLTTSDSDVDGFHFTPQQFFLHDLFHAFSSKSTLGGDDFEKSIPRTSEFWDKFNLATGGPKYSDKRELVNAILFYMYHEYMAELTCNNPIFDHSPLYHYLSSRNNHLETMTKRFMDKTSDLGRALKRKWTEHDIEQTHAEVIAEWESMCGRAARQ